MFLHNMVSNLLVHDCSTGDVLSFLVKPRLGDLKEQIPDDEQYSYMETRDGMLYSFLCNWKIGRISLVQDFWTGFTATKILSKILCGFDTSCASIDAPEDINPYEQLFSVYHMSGASTYLNEWECRGVVVNSVEILDIVYEPDPMMYLYWKTIPYDKIAKNKIYEPIDFYRIYINKKDRYRSKYIFQ